MNTEIIDLLNCIFVYDKTDSLVNKGKYFDIIQKDVTKILINHYKSIDYKIIVEEQELDGEKWHIAYCNEFGIKACYGTGSTEIEAINNFKIEKDLFISYLLEHGIKIPEKIS